MKPPFFSIVTISFNQSRYIKQCIESVLQQDFQDFEYIIQDPGSTDSSREIIKSFKSKNLKIFFEEDKSPADGLNKGFSKAKGEFYFFLNSDDLITKDCLSSLYRIIKENPSYDVYSCGTQIIDEKGKSLRKAYSDNFDLNGAIYGHSILIQQSTTFRSSLFKSVGGFNVHNKAHWDGELFIEFALKSAKFFKNNKIISKYRITKESITGSGIFEELNIHFAKRMFEKVRGYRANKFFNIFSLIYRIKRKILNPNDTFQRIFFGAIYKRKLD